MILTNKENIKQVQEQSYVSLLYNISNFIEQIYDWYYNPIRIIGNLTVSVSKFSCMPDVSEYWVPVLNPHQLDSRNMQVFHSDLDGSFETACMFPFTVLILCLLFRIS